MPIYDYLCSACGHRFEQLAKLNELLECPACSSPRTERQFSFSAGISTGKTQGKANIEARRMRDTRLAEKAAKEQNAYERDHHDDH